MSNILFEFTVEASPQEVYKALTEAEGIKGWWTTDTTLKPKVGSQAEFRFGESGGFTFEVAQLEPHQRVVWKTVQAMPDWNGTRVTFDLSPENGSTKILFGHRDFATEDGSFASVSYSWAQFMFSLKNYLETGQGTPYQS